MSGHGRFTGERLHEGDPRFALDLARHRAAYELARQRLAGRRVADLGSGSGYGAALLADAARPVVGLDRARPDAASRRAAAHFCLADLAAPPLRRASFDAVLSFQVIEHLADPAPYLRAMGALLAPGGEAWITTPNRALSDGVNPYHVREYLSGELAGLLRQHFSQVELSGLGAAPAVRAALAARSRRIRRVMRLDPLRLRERLPRAWLERLFAWGALLVRAGSDPGPAPDWRGFTPEPAADASSLDWLAVCRDPTG